jgi:hypothetical protein
MTGLNASIFYLTIIFVSPCLSEVAEHFIFTGKKVHTFAKSNEFVVGGEKLSVAQLKRRFARYKVVVTVGEDCFICATISGKGGSIEVNFDEDGKLVVGVYSFDKTSSDALGNNVGLSLRNAIGSPTAQCDAGIWTTCQSTRLNGLSYIVQDNDKCPVLNAATDRVF